MKNLEYLIRGLDNRVLESPFMIHGGSIEAVFELAKSDRLPSGITYEDDFDGNDGRLFFFPVDPSKFESEKYDGLSVMGRGICFKATKHYAEMTAFTDYLANQLGCQTAALYNILNDWGLEFIEPKEVQVKLRKHNLKLPLRNLASLESHARRRKGVLIEVDESILELPHGIDECDNNSLYVKCPNGLDKRYIKRIELLGPVEKKLMERYLQGKFRYKGFRIEIPMYQGCRT